LRLISHLAMGSYCLAIYLVLDFSYSALLHDQGHSPGIPDPTYHHTLAPNFDGYDHWGDTRFKVYTDSLGFRDGRVRDVPASPSVHRVLLMGDSFTEAIGVDFEDSFAGLLYAAGMARAQKIEFLNAGVISYSPVLYYRKIKFLIEQGVHFDEVVVFSDESDVRDEATGYFCEDENPSYQKYCGQSLPYYARSDDFGSSLRRHFVVTDTIRVIGKFWIQGRLGNQKRNKLAPSSETAWIFSGADAGNDYAPLGIDGGIERSLANMQMLADLLKKNGIPMTIAVYPWPALLAAYDPDNRQVTMWREFCARNCKKFINLFPAFNAEKAAHADWYERLYIFTDFHFSAGGNRLMFRELARELL
jgi:hypothetical protein